MLNQAEIDDLLQSTPTGCYIGGQWRPSADSRVLDVINPATEDKIAEVADGAPDDARLAAAAASAALAAGAATSPRPAAFRGSPARIRAGASSHGLLDLCNQLLATRSPSGGQ